MLLQARVWTVKGAQQPRDQTRQLHQSLGRICQGSKHPKRPHDCLQGPVSELADQGQVLAETCQNRTSLAHTTVPLIFSGLEPQSSCRCRVDRCAVVLPGLAAPADSSWGFAGPGDRRPGAGSARYHVSLTTGVAYLQMVPRRPESLKVRARPPREGQGDRTRTASERGPDRPGMNKAYPLDLVRAGYSNFQCPLRRPRRSLEQDRSRNEKSLHAGGIPGFRKTVEGRSFAWRINIRAQLAAVQKEDTSTEAVRSTEISAGSKCWPVETWIQRTKTRRQLKTVHPTKQRPPGARVNRRDEPYLSVRIAQLHMRLHEGQVGRHLSLQLSTPCRSRSPVASKRSHR